MREAFEYHWQHELGTLGPEGCWSTWQAACEWQKQKDAEICNALKAGQGEPVAWQIHNQIGHDGKKYTMLTDCKETANAWKNVTPLYTAPTIPEGWRLVPVEPTPEMLQDGFENNEGSVHGMYLAMLAAAPKPEDE